MKRLSCCAILLFVFSAFAAEPDAKLPPIKAIIDAAPKADAIKFGKEPTVFKTEAEAAKAFGDDVLAALKKQVDFEHQIVLVFAWQGSGQDKLDSIVAESFPEQITFKLTPGRTRDSALARGRRSRRGRTSSGSGSSCSMSPRRKNGRAATNTPEQHSLVTHERFRPLGQ